DYAMFRWMGPEAGRFLSADPVHGSVGDGQSWNRYSYALNDPVNRWDPWGLEPTPKVQVHEVHTVWGGGGGKRYWNLPGGGTVYLLTEAELCRQYGVDIIMLPCNDGPVDTALLSHGRPVGDGEADGKEDSAPPTYRLCYGDARMMVGNMDHVRSGQTTAFGTPKQAHSTAVIPRQWSPGGKAALRPHRQNVFGVVEGATGFNGIDDVMDHLALSGATTYERQTHLLQRDAGTLLLEVPDNPQDTYGSVLLDVPGELGGCPEGTSEIGRVD
ncbi:hypothetical protein L0Y59_02305, partial [Candidatus Uhrbacteria bacterium]|nr:hypothetical protein [Candidatus Uhrbacteria bacterium]